MGAWTSLSADDTGGVLAYLRTFERSGVKKHYPDAEVIGSESKGRVLIDGACAQCHGDRGEGMIGPAVMNADFVDTAGDGFMMEMVSYGRSETKMRPNLRGLGGTADLSVQDIKNVVAYIRSSKNDASSHIGRETIQGDIGLGRRSFAKLCAQCHGTVGSGGNGPAIGRGDFVAQVSDGFITGMAANGRSGTEMKGFAPGAGGFAELGEHEIRSVVSYLRSQSDKGLIQPKRVTGTAGLGEELYSRRCAQCHGSWGNESFAPHLTNPVFLEAASDSYLQATMALGRHQSAMRSMMRGSGGLTEMTSKEVNDVIAYLRESAPKPKPASEDSKANEAD